MPLTVLNLKLTKENNKNLILLEQVPENLWAKSTADILWIHSALLIKIRINPSKPLSNIRQDPFNHPCRNEANIREGEAPGIIIPCISPCNTSILTIKNKTNKQKNTNEDWYFFRISVPLKKQWHPSISSSPSSPHSPNFHSYGKQFIYCNWFLQHLLQSPCRLWKSILVCLYLGRTIIFLDCHATKLYRIHPTFHRFQKANLTYESTLL